MRTRPRHGALLTGASLRIRVMAAAAFLVVLTSVVTGVLGTTLLRSYLLARSDSQLSNFTKIASRILTQHHRPVPRNGQQPALPTQFLVEIISASAQVQTPGGSLHAPNGPQLNAALLATPGGKPFIVPATGAAGHSWRVLVQPASGGDGRHLVTAYSMDDLNSTVTRLEVADATAGAIAVALLAGIGLPLVRASLAPLARIEATAAAIAGGDFSRRIDHPSTSTEVGRLADALDTMLATIEAAYRARSEGEARALRSEERMRLFIADASHELRTPLTSVRGLAEYGLQQGGEASRVFERFYRTDSARTRACGGAGLGLAIAASLTAAHGGQITVDTEPGHGTAFHVRLPIIPNDQV